MSIVVAINVSISPEIIDEYKGYILEKIAETRKFDGCLDADVYFNQDIIGEILVLERWLSRDHQNNYFKYRSDVGNSNKYYISPIKFSFYNESLASM